MSDHLQHELKKEFQLERMILFSDAVFAIAITLLAIELKLPAEVTIDKIVVSLDRHSATDPALLTGLGEMMGKFIGFFISFFIIGLYWTVHHRMFGYVVNYNNKLLRLNLIYLMAIVLMPFSTALYSEYAVRFLKVPVIIYTINIIFLAYLLNLFYYIAFTSNRQRARRVWPLKLYLFYSIVCFHDFQANCLLLVLRPC